jgi:pyruvate dehydrogenase E2 component (dihydrolipoamide acetyltransferase)
VNASFDEDAILQHADVNVGIAVSLDDGLIAPAIRNADRLSLPELKAERVRLTEAAQAGKLTMQEAMSATFTISNLGPLGIRRFRALVVPPQAAILAVGTVAGDGRMSLSLSCDHRVLDGAPAARFLGELTGRLEQPDWVERLL